ncbi:uncharacterized protein LOC127286358 isoform X2 [Leptopilina boulardi]|uniref:uncharacterized protein LOC127286358 isoform X2 n=1 Tax=Leptopilina boulardi TaxID=63433 RepID=UPI0021F5E88F|nr:uncharacterized protein LOC127286358 isoform X2 [Leptopilina boulardi]
MRIYNHLINMGGVTLRQFLANSLKQIMTDNLVCSFTWNKGSDTLAFGNTKVSNVLFQSAKKCINFEGPANKQIFKDHMLEVLRHTKQRHRKRLRKNRPENGVGDEDDDLTAVEQEIARLEAERYSNYDASSENEDESYDDSGSDENDSYTDEEQN